MNKVINEFFDVPQSTFELKDFTRSDKKILIDYSYNGKDFKGELSAKEYWDKWEKVAIRYEPIGWSNGYKFEESVNGIYYSEEANELINLEAYVCMVLFEGDMNYLGEENEAINPDGSLNFFWMYSEEYQQHIVTGMQEGTSIEKAFKEIQDSFLNKLNIK